MAEFTSATAGGDITADSAWNAAGDIIYATADDTAAVLSIGDTNAVLQVSGGVPAWTTSPTIGSTSWGNATHAHAATNSGGTIGISAVTGLGTDVATFLGTPSSANLRTALTDETGTGGAVFATSPTLTSPALGTPSALVLTSATGLPVGGLANGTDGQLITWGTDAVATVVAVGTSTHVLTSNGAGNPPTFQAAAGGKNVGFILALS